MLPAEKVELLLAELGKFVEEECFAIEQEDWDYLQRLLKKKECHLLELSRLKPLLSAQPDLTAARSEKIRQGESRAQALLAGKLETARLEQAQLEDARGRMNRVRELVKMQGDALSTGVSAKLRADA